MTGHQNSEHMALLRQIKAEYIEDTRIERY